ncbi:MAG: protein-glutamate O-methyltransferase CheR [Thioalkalispiraceae bacterium]
MAAVINGSGRERDFELTEKHYNFVRKLVAERTGIALSDAKRDMIYGRLTRRLRALDLSNFDDYCAILKDGNDEQELIEFTNAITTNLTAFFREQHHFDYLGNTVLPELMRTKQNRSIRIWSAGCSSGEEPYSIAMVVNEVVPADWDVRILATDLDSNMVERARAGIYPLERVEGISKQRLRNWVRRGKGSKSNMVKMSSDLQDIIRFKQLNLMHDWPMRGKFDIIFCRNVVIYFSKDTQKQLFNRYADIMTDNSHLFIGHSESLYKVSDRFKLLGQTMYKKVK